jgi:hypothetical protein
MVIHASRFNFIYSSSLCFYRIVTDHVVILVSFASCSYNWEHNLIGEFSIKTSEDGYSCLEVHFIYMENIYLYRGKLISFASCSYNWEHNLIGEFSTKTSEYGYSCLEVHFIYIWKIFTYIEGNIYLNCVLYFLKFEKVFFQS